MFKFKLSAALFAALFFIAGCQQENNGSDSGTAYESVDGDPLNTRIYTLDNGLTVYISPFKDEPRIQTMVAVRAGSKYDPAQTTGLAHYLEHMVFKGTHRMGTVNWEEESKLLDQISAKYEEHLAESDPEKKKAIYAQIDSLSFEASKYAVPNEYDKMVSSLGAKGTNAFTSNDMTVYINDIPSNEFEKWLKLEAERFQTLVLRLFHTELETVYEEFNRNVDRDGRWSYEAVMQALMPNHPYGTQSTIGEGEHLKNPSMVNIHNYFNTYYRPNNVAIILSGDIDPDKAIGQIEQYFGSWEAADIPEFTNDEVPELSEVAEAVTVGPEPEHVYIGYKLPGATSEDLRMARMMDMLLANSSAGLIDINLKQKQKVLEAYSFINDLKDHSVAMFYGMPREGQSLEEVRDLLLGQIELVKSGDFDEWMMDAVIRNLKLREMKQFESNSGRAFKMMDAFILEKKWADAVNEIDALGAYSKEDIVAFANKYFRDDNYVVSYKRKGDKQRESVEKPEITPIEMNRDTQSEFYAEWAPMEMPRVEPVFLDYQKDIQQTQLASGVPMAYIQNNLNETFNLSYIFDMGSENDKWLKVAIDYLPYLGTEEYSAEELQKEFYKLGVNFNVFSSGRQSYVQLAGLEESLEAGVELFEHILGNVVADQAVYDGLVQDILKSREDRKDNKSAILWNGMRSYMQYGPNSPMTDILSADELKQVDVNELTEKIRSLRNYEHRVFYFGQKNPEEVTKVLDLHHKVPENLLNYPERTVYPELDTDEPKVYFAHYDMKQAEVILMSKDEPYNKDLAAYAYLFNEYFGSGLSSIVFQEIREQKALAYAAFSSFRSPAYQEDAHYLMAYVGTQADKLEMAVTEMKKLLNDMPEAEMQFESARDAAMKKIETDRITRSSIYWNYETAKQRGLDYDLRRDIYEQLKTMTMADLKTFFNEHIAGKERVMAVIGDRNNVDQELLKSMGDYKELSLEEIFNY